MFDHLYKYSYNGVYSDTKKGLIKALSDMNDIEYIDYRGFNNWCARFKEGTPFDVKVDTYIRYKLLLRDLSKVVSQKYIKRYTENNKHARERRNKID